MALNDQEIRSYLESFKKSLESINEGIWEIARDVDDIEGNVKSIQSGFGPDGDIGRIRSMISNIEQR